MNRGPVIFISAFFAFAISFGAFVLAPQIQLGRQALTVSVANGDVYPNARAGQAAQGAQVYRAQGCVACHSQQVRQDGMNFDVILTDGGTNHAATLSVLEKLASKASCETVPVTALAGLTDKNHAVAAVKALTEVGAKASIAVMPFGADIARGWGARRSVAADYLFDLPVQLGSSRLGPDLANVGARLPDANWQLIHLFNPQAVVKGSVMPPHRFLFTTQKIKNNSASPHALVLPAGSGVKDGYEVIPTDDARALVAYLQSLRVETPLFEAPLTPPAAPAVTNAIVK